MVTIWESLVALLFRQIAIILFDMHLNIEFYSSRNRNEWNSFLVENGTFTFQFYREFLDLFVQDECESSIIVKDSRGQIIALMPISVCSLSKELVSHSKSTYGGVIYKEDTKLQVKQQIYSSIIQALGIKFPSFSIEVRTPPTYLGVRDSLADRWILWNLGFTPSQVVLHSVIDLGKEINLCSRRVKQSKFGDIKAVEVFSQDELLALGGLVKQVLFSRHGVNPVHSPRDLLHVKMLFPDFIRVFVAKYLGVETILGGLIFFNTENSFHLQYMAVSEEGRKQSVGDLLILESIRTAVRENSNFFGFGHSNEDEGRTLNTGLLSYKQKFGGYLSEAISWKYRLPG
jgi:Acetyltransferase (GNAT) domain